LYTWQVSGLGVFFEGYIKTRGREIEPRNNVWIKFAVEPNVKTRSPRRVY
jgi:hypothetical protein